MKYLSFIVVAMFVIVAAVSINLVAQAKDGNPARPAPKPCKNEKHCPPTATPTMTATPTVTPTATISPIPTETPTPTPTPVVISFIQNQPVPVVSDPLILPPDYRSMTFHATITGSMTYWSIKVSIDGGATFQEQYRIRCDGSTCPDVTIPIISDTYVVASGDSTGNFTVTASMNEEPNAQGLLLGYDVPYPHTSGAFDTDGFSTITIAAGAGNTPQNLTGISLQREDSPGVFGETSHLACDGEAHCPLESLSMIGGRYRVVLEGSGTGAILSAIMRP